MSEIERELPLFFLISHTYMFSYPDYSCSAESALVCIHDEENKYDRGLGGKRRRIEEKEGSKGEEEISKILHLSGGVFSGAGIMRV